MRNPLHKRIPRQLVSEFGKYVVVFIILMASIGFISGFLVASTSMIRAYQESFEKYNIENGNFEVLQPLEDQVIKEIEEEGNVTLYNNYFVEEEADTDLSGKNSSTIRIFKNRKEVDKVCLMEGEIPTKENEIAIDRMYAKNNDISINDVIKIDGKKIKVTGLVALSDYSALFSNNADMMFDAVKFGVGIMTEDGFEQFGDLHIFYNYSWKYDKEPKTENSEKKRADKLLEIISGKCSINNYIPRYTNNAINFTGDDLGSDKSMMIMLLYILIVIIAFIFSVTINNTINKEAPMIGTLRASGYTKAEIIKHYMELPFIVTLMAAVVGNVLGYSLFKEVCVNLYYNSYSLPTYTTIWSGEAFILTTIVPCIIMLIVNFSFIIRKLRLMPIKFIRNDLSTSKRKKAIKLPGFKFINRFRIRIIIQNRYNYLTLLIGIIFANILLLFGMMLPVLLDTYNDSIIENMVADYQYVLKAPLETGTKDAEKYYMLSMKESSLEKEDEVTVYGISDNSKYFDIDFTKDDVYISDVYADKYQLKIGDEITLKESYGTKKYKFKIGGIYQYPMSMSIFMSQENYCEKFGVNKEEFTGYFSNEQIKDISQEYIYSIIKEEDLTKMARQMDVSMGSMMQMVNIFAFVLSMLIMYLLIKLIIEKNSLPISMVKILGYENREIRKLYLTATTWVTVFCIAISIPICVFMIEKLMYRPMMSDMKGWIILTIDPVVLIEMFLLGILAYIFVSFLEFRRIKKIPMSEALKNVE